MVHDMPGDGSWVVGDARYHCASGAGYGSVLGEARRYAMQGAEAVGSPATTGRLVRSMILL